MFDRAKPEVDLELGLNLQIIETRPASARSLKYFLAFDVDFRFFSGKYLLSKLL